MDMQDMSHIQKISEALWNEDVGCRAAVMIGTGFSANADKLSQSTPDMPMWNELRKRMLIDLGMQDVGQDALTVADLYESSFGKSQLEAFLMKNIPDREFSPGTLHEILLKLPWSDVFTTNYDTLLEREASQLIERRYSYVYSAEDIPLSRSPRIVKLHGTFQRNRPLVFSREDYRQYPVKNAPFVNLVQESIMENIFCLLGFSGTDPNFLQWIGWVRDNLKEYRPIIYLCGLLDLNSHERKRLEKLNIQPIDLTPLYPREQYPNKGTRYRLALTWFLQELQKGEPCSPEKWPFFCNEKIVDGENKGKGLFSNNKEDIYSTEKSLDEIFVDVQHGKALIKDVLEEICKKFRTVREQYPGWIIAPYNVRKNLYHSVIRWRYITERVCEEPSISLILKLCFLYELEWRSSTALYFMDGPFLEKAIAVMECINPFPKHIMLLENCLEPEIPSENVDWEEISEWWVSLALAVMRFARVVQKLDVFNTWSKRVESVKFLDEEWNMKWHYEQCMEALFLLDRETLLSALEEWDVSKGRPIWKIRKASLLAEVGNLQNAKELVGKGIKEIRDRESCKGKIDVALFSEEGCALALARALSFPSVSPIETEKRLKILGKYQSNPLDEIRILRLRIRDYQPELMVSKKAGYDPGAVVIRHTFRSNREYMFDAVNMFCLFEIIAMPVHAGTYVPLEEIAKAVDWIRPIIMRAALVMVMRKGKAADIAPYFSRPRVAELSQTEVDSLFTWFYQCLYRSYEQMFQNRRTSLRNEFLVNAINMSMTALSYLSFRLIDDDKHQLYDFLLRIFQEKVFLHSVLLARTLDDFIKRLIFCSTGSAIAQYALPLVSLPVLSNCSYYEYGNDPIVYLLEHHSHDLEIDRRENEGWKNAVDQLVHNVQSGTGELRKLSNLRLIWLLQNKVLTEQEDKKFGSALWNNCKENTDDLPKDTGVYMFQFLVLPDPRNMALQNYKAYIANHDFGTFVLKSSERIENSPPILYSMSCINAIHALRSDEVDGARKYIEWSREDAQLLLEKIKKFWTHHVDMLQDNKMIGDIFFSRDFCMRRIHDVMMNVSKVFGRMVLPYIAHMNQAEQVEAKKIFKEMEKFPWSNVILPFKLCVDSNAGEQIKNRLHKDLLSNDSQRIEDALNGIYEWINFFPKEDAMDIRKDIDLNLLPLVDQMIDYLYLRKRNCLITVMQYVTLLVRYHKDEILTEKRLEKLTDALGYMFDDISINNELETLSIEEKLDEYLIQYQAYGAALSYYIFKFCYGNNKLDEVPETLKKWREHCKTSTLPEIKCWFKDA